MLLPGTYSRGWATWPPMLVLPGPHAVFLMLRRKFLRTKAKNNQLLNRASVLGPAKAAHFFISLHFQVIAFFAGAVSFGHIVKASEPVVSSFLNFAFLGEAGVTQGTAMKRTLLCRHVFFFFFFFFGDPSLINAICWASFIVFWLVRIDSHSLTFDELKICCLLMCQG